MPTFRLLQARQAGDPVRHEERVSFAAQLGVPLDWVLPHDLLSEETTLATVTDGVDAVLVGGSGKFSVLDDEVWLPPFFDVLGALADAQFPTFASCFGFQGMVLALGGEVEHDEPNAEVGTYELEPTEGAAGDPVFGALPSRFSAQLGHKDRATTFPSSAVLLARSVRCPYQALRVGEKVYATQFHPELTHEANRMRFERYLDDYSAVFGEERAQRMLEEFTPSPHSDALLARFKEAFWKH
ncbi:MAG: type 1 glutamine amidotransferase [Alphaproteobacteria bacterium]|nr:type 1 glutamine amidotransferase [Alphaproteobacteria bacterium]